MDQHGRLQLREQRSETGAIVVAQPLDAAHLGQPDAMLHVLAHPAARLGDEQVHQLERRQPRRILHVGAARHLGGQHGLGLVIGPVSSHLDGLSHKTHTRAT